MATTTALPGSGVDTSAGPRPRGPRPGRVVAWICLVLILLVTLVPFYWMLRTAFSTNGVLSAEPGNLLPAGFTLDAFRRVFGLTTLEENLAQGGAGSALNFWVYLRNSVVVSTLITVGQITFSAMAAYAFSRLVWRGRNAVFALFLSALMVPGIFTAIPNFVLVKELGLLNTYAGIVLPTFFMTPFAIFFLRQFFLGIPREIEEAALIDGAGRARVFARIIVPMSSAPIMTLAVLTYIAAWNEYLWPLLVGQADNVRVLTVALGIFRSQTPNGTPDWSGLMAGTLVSALPIIVLFCVLGRRIVNSIGFSGIK
ncbi:binding-protein-dependent transport systems inner membrane component [Beutenbergia cavernae DSM 12333]|uniref:Binding-protein-dependent transport systems inner membrane component n=1 Tax=Beutenbergia cavernae (strain ATCC BAA-8 / DSM 12333 / CCUG 43141 / JCM 11478 / NBRC 16432 / NCIMB 13614 / HKI 0122) TaxID=471853 RepID=C5BYG3_BEUC1|nr:carbohydrate ABC transporter permease [Beutenbergia cavernae]ACQ81063.1 binding-protein-dependent transport systems inner membrane component [Beutenbergia cavernae DSM 12333]